MYYSYHSLYFNSNKLAFGFEWSPKMRDPSPPNSQLNEHMAIRLQQGLHSRVQMPTSISKQSDALTGKAD